MLITYNEEKRIFKLDAGESSYVLYADPNGYLVHLYYGKRIPDADLTYLLRQGGGASFCPNPPGAVPHGLTLDNLPQEYPCANTGDFRAPALTVQAADGAIGSQLKYVSHDIRGGKPDLPGLPHLWVSEEGQAETLVVTAVDELLQLEVELYYTAFANLNAVSRSAVIRNTGAAALTLRNAQSLSLDFFRSDYDAITLQGAWVRERNAERRPLAHGSTVIQSRRGSSGHQLNPFMMLCDRTATETQGNAYAVSLIYSGNFQIEAEVNQMHMTRLQAGLQPDTFAWHLAPGEAFVTPEAVLTFADNGLGGISRTLHRLYNKHLVRRNAAQIQNPILINNWEATYFNFDADKLVAIAREAAKADIDMLVMDDGWFGARTDDTKGLGDWVVNEGKLGCTLGELVERVKAEGLAFGIWFEPEMVNPNSDLYRAHPDWALHIPGRPRSLGRGQCVLNLVLPEVRDYLFDALSAILDSADIAYVKWDFNRNLTEVFSPGLALQGEAWHRYYLGLYELLERLTAKYPHILFESCSGGGGRFDAGMHYYMPQAWCSDNTNSVDRLKIQYGTSYAYPVSTMGAHVSAHSAPLDFKAYVAMAGTFGYELDLTKVPGDIARMKELNAEWRARRHIIAEGDMYRLVSPFETQWSCAWMFVTPDKTEAFVQFFSVRGENNAYRPNLYLQGLDPEKIYSVTLNRDTQIPKLSGAALMYAGLPIHCGGEKGAMTAYLTVNN
ncbi:MAG: alpha-galactosidase [Oscillospiraceae bacterium]|jgi:alpha-galactosidase|nr:alpha-galactosidase [Oscillospiraceae bacterium]